jgi:isoleucyl-tRNA synthetase
LKNKDAIASKVLADVLDTEGNYAVSKDWNINGEDVTITIEKV